MYALSIEKFSVLKSDVKEILKLGVPHISAYSLILEPNTALFVNKVKPISEDLDYKMYKYIEKKFTKKVTIIMK